MLSRRTLGLSAGALALAACTQAQTQAVAANGTGESKAMPEEKTANIDWANLSETDWKARLTSDEFYVLRKEGTERPFTSPLNNIKAAGTYACAGCGLPLFKSDTKSVSYTHLTLPTKA